MYKSAFTIITSNDKNDLWINDRVKMYDQKPTSTYYSIHKFYPLVQTSKMFKPIHDDQNDNNSVPKYTAYKQINLKSPSQQHPLRTFNEIDKINELYIIEDFEKNHQPKNHEKRKRNLTTHIEREYCLDKFLDSLEDINNYLDQKLVDKAKWKRSTRRSTQPITINRDELKPKMSQERLDKKYVSLSDILSQDTKTTDLNDLLTVQVLFEELKLDCDEQIKKLDLLEIKRKEYQHKQNEILKMLNNDLVFKNRVLQKRNRKKKNFIKHKNLVQNFKRKRKMFKNNKINIDNFKSVQTLVRTKFSKQCKLESNVGVNQKREDSILRRNNLKSIKRNWSKDAFKKKESNRNGLVINEDNLLKNQKLMELVDACRWLIDAGYSKIVHTILNNTKSCDFESVLNLIDLKNLHEYDQLAIQKRLEILYSSIGEKIDYKYLIENFLNIDEDEDESNEEDYCLGCTERDDTDIYDNYSPIMPLIVESTPINRVKCIDATDQRNSLNLIQNQSKQINRFHSFRLDDKLKSKRVLTPNLAENSNLSKSYLDLTNPNILESQFEFNSSESNSTQSSTPSSPLDVKPKSRTATVVISLKKSFNRKDDEDNLPKLEVQDEKIVANLLENDEKRERRDSGVGGSLTREISKRREKWSSFVKSHRPSFKSSKMSLTNLNVKQIAEIKSKCFVKIEGKIEKYNQSQQKNAWNRFKTVPKFIKRHQKSIDHALYKHKNVFGVPLKLNFQRNGQPLPQSIIQIMKYIRKNCSNTLGIFRKSGSKTRMCVIRDLIERTNQFNPDEIEKKLILLNLNNCNDLNSIGSIGSGLSSHSTSKSDLIAEDFSTNETMGIDLADILKQYFRELPECIFSNKQSQNLIDIFSFVPESERLEAVQFCMITQDDEYRDSIQCLLYFLHDISKNFQVHKMDARNLAICLAPTLLNINMKDLGSSSSNPSSPHSNSHFFSKDSTSIVSRQCNASLDCLAFLIENSKKIFQIPLKLYDECQFTLALSYKSLNYNQIMTTIKLYLTDKIAEMFKELKDKSRNWKRLRNDSSCEINYKEIDDEHTLLRLWKMTIEIDSSPIEIRNKILRARTQWDEELVESKIIEQIDPQTDVYQYVMHFMAPQPTRDFCELRHWTDATHLNPKYSYLIFSTSIEHEKASLVGDLRAITLRNFYLIESVSDYKCKVHQLYRGDYMGYSPDWYNKMQAYFLKRNLVNLKDSLKTKF